MRDPVMSPQRGGVNLLNLWCRYLVCICRIFYLADLQA
uniref:Uncharacterized protein n=1 Tax=Rhizophora mucronata TaxID=61149 RepID=A0A2P2P4M5_RHIMU